MPERLRWTLTDEDTGNSYVLTRDPKGWDELQLTHNRSEEYHGIFYDFSLEVAFSCKGSGKEFIDAIYDTKGTEGNVSILLEYKCPPHDWVTVFDGKLNFSTYKQEFRGKVLYTIVDIIKKGITQTVKAREDTDVDLLSETSINGTTLTPYTFAPYDLNLHSLTIKLRSVWDVRDIDVCTIFSSGVRNLHFVHFIREAGELETANDVAEQIESASVTTTGFPTLLENFPVYSYPMDIVIEYDVSGTYRDSIRSLI